MDIPSFSLGLDLDVESQSQMPSTSHTAQDSFRFNNLRAVEDDDECSFGVESGLEVMDSDLEAGPDPPRVLKRLRRGPVTEKPLARKLPEMIGCDNGDDDIEDFSSSQEVVCTDKSPAQNTSMCSSSKTVLNTCGILTKQSSNHCKAKKSDQLSNARPSANMETSQHGLVFPRLIVSPIRRFQLLDSDSDDLTVSENVSATKRPPLKELPSSIEQKRKASVLKPRDNDLWKDFYSTKSFHVATPVLDELCEEYFQSTKKKVAIPNPDNEFRRKKTGNCHEKASCSVKQSRDSPDHLPPAHHYFYNDDTRIQQLVRNRLPFFSPLINHGENQLPLESSVINYMNQFESGETLSEKVNRTNSNNLKRGRTNQAKNSTYDDSLGWVNPKTSEPVPKDAGKRRVRATDQSAGHWFTSPEGKKVYVSKTGQEFAGRSAYFYYRKESGGRFRSSKKKTTAKKKPTAKKKRS